MSERAVSRPRARWHARANAPVLAYGLGALAAVLYRGDRVDHVWLALHLLLLGAATNAIVVWSEHFSAAVLHTRPRPRREAAVTLIALNAGVITVLGAITAGAPGWVLVTGAVALLAAVAWHCAFLARAVRTSLGQRFAIVVWFYVAACVALITGGLLGVVMALRWFPGAESAAGLRLAHQHVNLLGWVSLAVLGTLVTLWPTTLRTRMVDGAVPAARRTLVLAVLGVTLQAAGFLTAPAARLPGLALAEAGLLVYAAGLTELLVLSARTLGRRMPREPSPWLLAAATSWLTLAVAADIVALPVAGSLLQLDAGVGDLIPALATGFVGQVLAGALTFLLPAMLGAGPSGARRLNQLLALGWRSRLVATNLGILLALAPVAGIKPVGWILVAAGLGTTVVLLACVLGVSRRVTATTA